MPHSSEVTLCPAHYSAALISAGVSTFSIPPSSITTLPDGSAHIRFDCERPHTAQEFANHLLRLKRTGIQSSSSSSPPPPPSAPSSSLSTQEPYGE